MATDQGFRFLRDELLDVVRCEESGLHETLGEEFAPGPLQTERGHLVDKVLFQCVDDVVGACCTCFDHGKIRSPIFPALPPSVSGPKARMLPGPLVIYQ